MDIGSAMFDELKKIMSTIEVKYDYKSRAFETDESRTHSEFYQLAKMESDLFEHFKTFDEGAVRESGIASSPITIELYAKNPSLIPIESRDLMMRGYRRWMIETYIDKNEYFRIMSGYPSDTDLDYLYVDPEYVEAFGISPLTPVHELSDGELLALSSVGFIEKLIKENPQKRYLQFLGINSVDPSVSRAAKNFGIVRIDSTVDSTLYEQFIKTYTECREYVVTVLYNRDFSTRYRYYDEFMAMNILLMTVQRMFVSTFQNVVSRDFFDLVTIKNLFDCYQIPFIENLPIDRQRLLVRNINKLLRYKSTNQVLQNICTILGYEQLNIVQHYLVKKHIMDVNGNPVFYTKTVLDEDTMEYVEVPDHKKMYEIYFQSVDISERNLALAFTDVSSQRNYVDIVTSDPYWWSEDDELMEALYEEEFNFIETKYLSINVMHRLSKMTFEVVHFLRMILDKKSQSRYITMSLPKIFGNESVSIFNSVVFLCALISKRSGMEGNILNSVTKNMTILGFDFKEDFEKIKKMINSDPIYSKDLLRHFNNLNIATPTDINRLYTNISDLAYKLKAVLANTQNIDEYRAYRKLYKAILVMDDTNTMFKMSDGAMATTYSEYLESEVPYMGAYIADATIDDINTGIEHTIHRISTIASELKYLSIISEENDIMINALMTLLRFFKSYTTDFTSFDVMYIMDDRAEQMVKLVPDIDLISSTDDITHDINVSDKLHIDGHIYHGDDSKTHAVMETISTGYTFKDSVELYDMFSKVSAYNLHAHNLFYKDVLDISTSVEYSDSIKYVDGIDIISNVKDSIDISVHEKLHIDTLINEKIMLKSKELFHIISSIKYKHSIPFRDRVDRVFKLALEDGITITDSLSPTFKSIQLIDYLDMNYSDMITVSVNDTLPDKMNIRDQLIIVQP